MAKKVTMKIELPEAEDVQRFIRTLVGEFPVKIEVSSGAEPEEKKEGKESE